MVVLDRENEPKISFASGKNYTDILPDIDEENENENESTRHANSVRNDLPPWDTFKCIPPKSRTGSMPNNTAYNISIRLAKVCVYGVLFCLVLGSGLVAKSALLFAVSQIREEKSVQFCNYYYTERFKEYQAKVTKESRILWTWCIVFIFMMPECFGILHAIWYRVFKRRQRMPEIRSIGVLFLVETLHPIGLALLVFHSLPKINSVEAAAISSCLCFVPALLNVFSRNREGKTTSRRFTLFICCDTLAVLLQTVGILLYPFLHLRDPTMWILPLAFVLSSCRWWINYVSHQSDYGFIRFLATVKRDLVDSRYLLEGYTAVWRSFVFLSCAIIISGTKGIAVEEFFKTLGQRTFDIALVNVSESFTLWNDAESTYSINNIIYREGNAFLAVNSSMPFYVLLLQALLGLFVYQVGKFACKTHMHRFGFALPLLLVTPGVIIFVIILSVTRSHDVCAFHNFIPDFLFFQVPNYDAGGFLSSWYVWCWLIWGTSQAWITLHIWSTEYEKLALVERIFCTPTYDSIMIDQFLALSKRKQENDIIFAEDEFLDNMEDFKIAGSKEDQEMRMTNRPSFGLSNGPKNLKENSAVVKIYACATMWHEEKEEMEQLIGSILRLDMYQCAMRETQNHYKLSIEDYYDLETHVFFDDAFCCMHGCVGTCDHDENETQVNHYVMTLVETVQKSVENLHMPSSPPIKCPTPYGGRLVWILPGNTRLMVHLKDKNKIRHRKRWSQVMYMYYLLGYRLMGLSIDSEQKESMKENTYVLTLDGDVDFRPGAVKVLIDLMKKDKELGAACGRIHPIGHGPMIWFQKFEYAIGHWLQKSTENTIGSVLCSPGCFSLFRAKTLMTDNVMAKYATESSKPGHYVQYDQGEDRWLCTLILQVGHRVEYSAASDAYTHAPQAFREFFVQRRRWIPSTVANIFDLLNTSKETREVNNHISWLYVVYQWLLMGSTILGPGTIFLMLVGALVATFHIDNWTSLCYNMIPLIIFVITCMFCKEDIQLFAAEIITFIYGLVMVVVLVGIMLQIVEDGLYAPTTLFFFTVVAQLTITGLLHPKECTCLIYGIIYYITVPSMYMILIIFSIFNVHNVTWGTRANTSQSTYTKKVMEKRLTNTDGSPLEQRSKRSKRGRIEFSLSSLFKCVFCTWEEQEGEEKYLNAIHASLNEINTRLEHIERKPLIEDAKAEDKNQINRQAELYDEQADPQHRECADFYGDKDSESESLTESSTASVRGGHCHFLISPYWLQDERMRHGEVDFLSTSEEEFWKGVIHKYLQPIDNDDAKQIKMAEELRKMRNQYTIRFFMMNALFVLIVFLMQLNKDVLHLQWPVGAKYNVTYSKEQHQIRVYTEYLHLEPIGCVFIAAFLIVLLIQFLAMLVHRFSTFSHILANTKLKVPFRNKKTYLLEDIIAGKYAEDIVESLLREVEDERVREDGCTSPKNFNNFTALFRKKLDMLQFTSSKMPKGVIKAFQARRSEISVNFPRSGEDIVMYDEIDNFGNNAVPGGRATQRDSFRYEYDNPTFHDENGGPRF